MWSLERRLIAAAATSAIALIPTLATRHLEAPPDALHSLKCAVDVTLVPLLATLIAAPLAPKQRRIAAAITALTTLPIWWLGAAVSLAMPSPQRTLFRLLDADPGTYFGLLLTAVLFAILLRPERRDGYNFDALASEGFGDARWMTLREAAALFPPDGDIVVGEVDRPDHDPTRRATAFDPKAKTSWGRGGTAPLATFKLNFDSTHMLFFAGSGGYKTTSTVVPTALRYGGSMVVLDPSCEVHALVGAHRSALPNRRICVLDPTRPLADIASFNVLEPLLDSQHKEADAVAFARLLSSESPRKENGAAAYFQEQAHNLLTGLLLHVLVDDAHEQSRSLRALRGLTSLSETDLKKRLTEIVARTRNTFIKQTLSPFVGMADQTFTGVASTVAKDTQWLSLDAYAALVCGDQFSTSDLPAGDLDVFVQIPGEILKSYPGVGRVIIGSLMRAMVQADGRHARRVLFCLDEVDLLGYMNVLEEARDRGRKYGITLMLMYQSVGQLEHHFGKQGATSWFEGVSFVSYAAIKSMDTAKQLSERCGERTIKIENQSHGTSLMFGPMSPTAAGKHTQSFSLQKRPLILPHEIVQDMRADEQIIAVRGHPPLRMGRAIYFRRPEMAAAVGTSRFK